MSVMTSLHRLTTVAFLFVSVACSSGVLGDEIKGPRNASVAETESPPVAADIDLNEQNYKSWRDHILPETSELAWEKIPWLTTFKDGLDAADRAGKPLLLWTMNGHPLGCT